MADTEIVPLTVAIAAPVPTVRLGPLDRLPGSSVDNPSPDLAAGVLVGQPPNTKTAYRRGLQACCQLARAPRRPPPRC